MSTNCLISKKKFFNFENILHTKQKEYVMSAEKKIGFNSKKNFWEKLAAALRISST